MIRLVMMAVFLLVFFILSIPIFLIEWILGKFNKHAKDISSLRIIQMAFKCLLFLGGIKTTVIGFEKIPQNEAVLYVGNHKGYFDIVIPYSKMKGLTGFVAKKEMEKIPIIRMWMKMVYCLFLDRKNLKQGLKTILLGIEYIKSGVSMAIFPEGTRNSKEEAMLPFHEGSFKFAEKSGCKIIPMVQNNTEQCMEAHMPFIKKTHTVLEFCDPIDIQTLSKEDRKFLGAYVQRIIQQKYDENKKLV